MFLLAFFTGVIFVRFFVFESLQAAPKFLLLTKEVGWICLAPVNIFSAVAQFN
tara:strand:+ start:530 stop:688 length:159 start_codon:yes stop_codon:yes gene_type:complete